MSEDIVVIKLSIYLAIIISYSIPSRRVKCKHLTPEVMCLDLRFPKIMLIFNLFTHMTNLLGRTDLYLPIVKTALISSSAIICFGVALVTGPLI